MTDIAELGLAIRSDGVVVAKNRLKDMTTQASLAERVTASLIRRVGALVGAYASWRIVEATVSKFVSSTIEAERKQRQLETVVKSTGMAAGYTAGQLDEMAKAFQNVTSYGDETIKTAQALLLTFTRIGRDVFPEALEAVMNVSTAMGTDLSSAALQVGKALNDPTLGLSALSRMGIQFTQVQKDLVKGFLENNDLASAQAVILKELERQFGNSARAARGTLGGAFDALKEAWGDLFELNGPQAETMRQIIETIVDKLKDPGFVSAVQNFGIALFNAINAVLPGVQKIMEMFVYVDGKFRGVPLPSDTHDYGKLAGPDSPMFKELTNQLGDGSYNIGPLKLYGSENIPDFGLPGGSSSGGQYDFDMSSIFNDALPGSVAAMRDAQNAPAPAAPPGVPTITDELIEAQKMAAEELKKVYAGMMDDVAPLLAEANDPFKELQSNVDKLSALLNAGEISWEQYGDAVQRANLLAASSTLGSIGQITGILSQAFEDNKLLAAANAAVNTAEGITKALAQGGMFAWPTAIAIGVAGAAQIAGILSASPGSASVNMPSGGGQQAAGPQQGAAINLTITGDGVVSTQSFMSQLTEQIDAGHYGDFIKVIDGKVNN